MALGWRAGGVLRALAAGIVLTLVAMLILLPYQDIGWGYRYVHGLIGSAALLAAFAWTVLTAQASESGRRLMRKREVFTALRRSRQEMASLERSE